MNYKKSILIVFFVSFSFSFGAYWAIKKLPPYYELKTFYKEFSNNRNESIESNTLAENVSNFVKKTKLNSVHLPLEITEYDIRTFIQDIRFGGLCSTGDLVIGVGQQGNFYSVDLTTNSVTRIKIAPPDDFKGSETYYFEIHDLECKAREKGVELYISYDIILNNKRHISLNRAFISNNSGHYKMTGDWETVFLSDPWDNIFIGDRAGRIKILQSGKILLSVGAIKNELMSAQDNSITNGKIVLIEPSSGEFTIFSSGHRNSQGITQTAKGVIYTTEHGPLGGDELNILKNNNNYGFPLYTHGSDYEKYSWRDSGDFNGRHKYNDKFTGPIFSWVPSIAVSNLIEVSDFHDRWDHDLLIGTLKDRSIYRIRLNNDRVIFSEQIWIGKRIRDIVITSGRIVMLSDSGEVLSITVDYDVLDTNFRANKQALLLREPSMTKCFQCHSFGITNPTNMAPSLKSVIGRNIGGDSNYERYSKQMSSMKETIWNKENLTIFLKNPNKYIPGTTMPDIGLNSYEIYKIVELLSTLE